MSSLIICNTASDSISKISVDNFSSEELFLKLGDKPLGPSGICIKKNRIYTANNYGNSISTIDFNTFKEEESLYVGAHPNDLVNYKDYLYIACTESNTVVVYDLKEKKIAVDIATNNWPHNIEISEELGLVFVSNFQSSNVSIIDINTNKIIKNIIALEYPTKVKISIDRSLIYVCESYMGDDTDGYIEIFDLNSLMSLKRVKVGKGPIDILEDKENLFVCNFGEGTLSIIDRGNFKEVNKINLGGMPKSIVKYNNNIFVSDYLNGRIMSIDLKKNKIKVITVGKEPNAMTLC